MNGNDHVVLLLEYERGVQQAKKDQASQPSHQHARTSKRELVVGQEHSVERTVVAAVTVRQVLNQCRCNGMVEPRQVFRDGRAATEVVAVVVVTSLGVVEFEKVKVEEVEPGAEAGGGHGVARGRQNELGSS